MSEKRGPAPLPQTEEIRQAYEEASHRSRRREAVTGTRNTIIIVLAVIILLAVHLLPVLRIYGQSMGETLRNGELVISHRGSRFKTGDVIAFYYNNNILVKRVIAQSGDTVDIDMDGNVLVNKQKIEEPYLDKKAYGEPDVVFPYQVPEGRLFVLGDNREISVDSRSTSMGCVSSEQIVGKVSFRIWPLNRIGRVK